MVVRQVYTSNFDDDFLMRFSLFDGCDRLNQLGIPGNEVVRNVQVRKHTLRIFVINPLFHISQKAKITAKIAIVNRP